MGYYINTTIKMTFKEYNKFLKHCKDNITEDDKRLYNISSDELDNEEFIDKLFPNFEMDSSSISINESHKYGSGAQRLIDSYIKDVTDDEERYDEIGYVSMGDEIGDIEFGGCIDDAPFISIDSNMNFNNKILKPGVLKIIID